MLIFALAGAVALGKSPDKTKTKSVTFASDITVNGTLVKAGAYDVKFDEQTGDLSIMKEGCCQRKRKPEGTNDEGPQD